MRIRLLLGPAGSGKTFRCLAEIRRALLDSPVGPPLFLVAPKQSTYQLERQLLLDPALPGYTRLQILSFERLAHFVFQELRLPAPRMLDEEGRLMVLRSLLAQRRNDLKLFRASARLTGFAQQLSLALSELQRNQLSPESLNQLAGQVPHVESLAYKLADLATLLRDYLDWLQTRGLQDADSLLPAAALALQAEEPSPRICFPASCRLWVDGFAEFSEQELDLLAALMPWCEEATFAFCLDQFPKQSFSWMSSWSAVRRTFEKCHHKFAALPNAEVRVELMPRDPECNRFKNNAVLRHLEHGWTRPEPLAFGPDDLGKSLRVAVCPDPEAEVTLAAREILRHVRAGGRYRDVTVLVRKLEGYHHALQRVFSRYEIPLFLDRRESVSHHPLAELTRNSLRTLAFQWQQEDWFAALKTGLVPASETEIDRLENESLARGWRGSVWQKPIVVRDDEELSRWLAELHRRLLPPFHKLALDLAVTRNKPTGAELAKVLRQFWSELEVEQTLSEWAVSEFSTSTFRVSGSVHATVWDQMSSWVNNLELAFPAEPLSLREWLPILEAGLANLSVGVIPPALDQVLVGSIDRSRNPDVKLAIVLGLNEKVFPAPPPTNVLLTESDRVELGRLNATLGSATQQHLARERYFAYIACTRARDRLVLTYALADTQGTPLNVSPFLSQLRQLFPNLTIESQSGPRDWQSCEHLNEFVGPLLKVHQVSPASPEQAVAVTPKASSSALTASQTLQRLPSLAAILDRMRPLVNPSLTEQLRPELAGKIYGKVLRTSVSRMEQFAACPFKFFVHSGLRAQERKRFELDSKEQGTFQHDVLAMFHEQLRAENKRWRDIQPHEARERIAAIATGLTVSYRDGLLEASEQTRFMARTLTESLQDFAEMLVVWMRQQYRFDPAAVELPFGEDEHSPALALELPNGRQLELQGRIDRVDLFQTPGSLEALCVVVDYKSSVKQLDPVLVQHGLQLQLLTYLNVLRRWPHPQKFFGVRSLIPTGVFYVNLRGKYDRAANRLEALGAPDEARRAAYRHTGRFDLQALRLLDSRADAQEGDQFNYRLTKSGALHKTSREGLSATQFLALLDSVEANLREMGELVYSGRTEVAPYKKGKTLACEQCDYAAICRVDPWTHQYRILRKETP